jgi:membrane-bound lytic murein transglycosylase
MFTIKIIYTTGDSYGSSRCTDLIGACWDDINKAKESLKLIKLHNNYFNDKNRYRYNPDFKKNKVYEKLTEYSIALKDDDGNDLVTGAFWRGYFEDLISAEICLCGDDDEFLMTV